MGLTVYGGGGKPEEEKTVTAGTSVIEVLPSSGKVMKKVTVNPTPTESKEVTAGTSDKTVSPIEGKHLSGVTVHPTPSQEKTVIPKADGFKVSPDIGKLLSAVFVDGDSDLVAGNIKQGVNIFGVDGTFDNSHGAYVWKKCKQHPDISISMNLPSTAAAVLTVACDTVDLSQVGLSFFNGYKGYLTVHGFECEFEFTTTGKANFKWDGVWYERNLTYDPATQTLTVDDNWSGVFTKTFTKEPTIIDYVVSNDPTAYPDGGSQDGYWYEKFQLDPTLFGCTKYAVDKFTLSIDHGAGVFNLSHSLGIMPKLAFILGNAGNGIANLYYVHTYAQVITRNSAQGSASFFVGKNHSGTEYRSTSLPDYNTSDTNLHCKIADYYYLPAGVEYTLITMA